MTADVLIVDLGLGNLRSVARAVERAGAVATISADPDALRTAGRVIVPGQGAFRDGALAIAAGFGEALREVCARGAPYLGLCLGMQLLFESSEEAEGRGLGLLPGRVLRFPGGRRDESSGQRLKVPHMGWNEVEGRHPLLPDRGYFYFVHSFYCAPTEPAWVVGEANYGVRFAAAVAKDNVFGCQFHPEKSQAEGHALLTRFLQA